MLYHKISYIKAFYIKSSKDRKVNNSDGIFEASQDSRILEHMSVDLTTKENVVRYVKDALIKKYFEGCLLTSRSSGA